jgi:hypothetical protein
VVLCDRSVRCVRCREYLQELRQACVVRLVQDVIVATESPVSRLLRARHVQQGQAVDLDVVHRRQGRAVQVRVVGVWDPRQPEPWWLATDLVNPLIDIVAFDDRWMPIEEPCRKREAAASAYASNGRSFGLLPTWPASPLPLP